MPLKINSSFANNRNNGFLATKSPSVTFEVGDFVVYTGLGGVIPYSASKTLYMTVTGTFVLGETVTQATSGATGVVVAQTSTGITVKSITGTFDTTHLVTGGTSGATGTPSSILSNNKILGLSNAQVTAASADFAIANAKINLSTPVNVLDAVKIPVATGTATAALEGTYVDVDASQPGGVNVSATGTQILVTSVVDSGTIYGVIALTVA